METKCLNEYINEVATGETKAVEVPFDELSYGIENFSWGATEIRPTDEQVMALMEIRRACRKHEELKKAETPVVQRVAPVMKKCRCGHTIPEHLVMNASLGTSCPDCYDRLSC